MYILKIQGTGKIPDYIQIRDGNFMLIAYFKINNPRTALARCNLLLKMDEILQVAKELEYGKIQKLEL
ncbi:MAG: fructose-6-phosphate aldolase [Bacteroidota bacterium]